MPRINIPTRDEAPAETHAILDTLGKRFGFVPNLFLLMAMSPPALQAFVGIQGSLVKSLDINTIEAMGMASILGNTASGSVSVMTTVLSSGADSPEMLCAVPALNSRAPAMGKNGKSGIPCVAGSRARVKLCTTWRASNGRPFWKVTWRRKWNV